MAEVSGEGDILHMVPLTFKDGVDWRAHLDTDLRLKERMPELVKSWSWKANHSREDRPVEDNQGCHAVVIVRLAGYAKVAEYLAHKEHKALGAIQAPLLAAKHVVDVDVPAL